MSDSGATPLEPDRPTIAEAIDDAYCGCDFPQDDAPDSREVVAAVCKALGLDPSASVPGLQRALARDAFIEAEKDWIISRPELEWQVVSVNSHNALLQRLRAVK